MPVPVVDPLERCKIKRVIRAEYVKETDKTSLLHSEVVPKLGDRGLLAAHLTQGSRKWHGIVRVPEKDEQGAWRSRREHLKGIANRQGTFARLDLKSVSAIPIAVGSPLINVYMYQSCSDEITGRGHDCSHRRY